MAGSAVVLYEVRDDGVCWITLNRPDSLNAMNGELIEQMGESIMRAMQDRQVRVVVITGAGRGFSSGGDLRGQAAGRAAAAGHTAGTPRAPLAADFEDGVASLHAWQMPVSYALHTMGKPAIAAVNGPAAGAGMSVALACDLRVASDRARFTTAFRNVGLSGDFGGTYFLTRLAGEGVARELYFTGAVIDAAEALRLGIVNRVVPHDDLERETMELARQIADGPIGAYARMKRNFLIAAKGDLGLSLQEEALNMRLSGASQEAWDAGRAFVEKRKPDFLGGARSRADSP
jgi:2-(1,2-epoxy-1,2-dihydrophenyl)acetyl-CoA isomerase